MANCSVSPMRIRTFLLIALFGILFLSRCSSQTNNGISVFNSKNQQVGDVTIDGAQSAIVMDRYGQKKGTVRGIVVRESTGKRVGGVVVKDDKVSIVTHEGKPVGELKNEKNCVDASGATLGYVSQITNQEAAGGACLLLLLDKNLPAD